MHHVDATLSEESRSGIQLNCLSVSPASSFFLESLESLVCVMYNDCGLWLRASLVACTCYSFWAPDHTQSIMAVTVTPRSPSVAKQAKARDTVSALHDKPFGQGIEIVNSAAHSFDDPRNWRTHVHRQTTQDFAVVRIEDTTGLPPAFSLHCHPEVNACVAEVCAPMRLRAQTA